MVKTWWCNPFSSISISPSTTSFTFCYTMVITEKKHLHTHPSMHIDHTHHNTFEHTTQSKRIVFDMDMIFCQKVKMNWALLRNSSMNKHLSTTRRKPNPAKPQIQSKRHLFIIKKPYNCTKRGKLSSSEERPYRILTMCENDNVGTRCSTMNYDISICRIHSY